MGIFWYQRIDNKSFVFFFEWFQGEDLKKMNIENKKNYKNIDNNNYSNHDSNWAFILVSLFSIWVNSRY